MDAKHAQVGDGERTALVLFGLELAVLGLGGERLDFGRDAGETLAADVLDDGGDQTGRGGDGDTDVGLLEPVRAEGRGRKRRSVYRIRVDEGDEFRREGTCYSLPDAVSHPSSVGLGHISESQSRGLDDYERERETSDQLFETSPSRM